MNALRSTSPLWVAATALLLSASPLNAQMSAAKVRAEITFARGLAADWSFVDLAEDVLREVEDAGVTGKMSEQLGLVRCDIFSMGARNEREHGKREELFERAITAYEQFIERNPYSDLRSTAEAAMVDTSAVYANAIEAALEEAVGEEVERLRTRQSEVLQAAVEKTGDLITELESVPPEDRREAQVRELHTLMLNRGNMLADIAQTQEDGTYYYERATETFENLAFESGEGSPAAMRAFIGLGKVGAYQKRYDEALSYYEAVIETAWPTDKALWQEILKDGVTDGEKQTRFKFLELTISSMMDACVNLGEFGIASKYGLHYYNTQRQEGITYSGFGYLSLLEVARALLESSGYVGGSLTTGDAEWYATEEEMKAAGHSGRNQIDCLNLALRIAQNVNDDNKGNILQVKAQKLISEIITRPGTTPSPDILFEAAQGEYFEQNYPAALAGFRRVLRAIEGQDQALRIEYGAKVMNHIGNTFRKMDRPLEASMAFREGCTTWAGDPEYDEKNAQGYYKMISDVARDAVLDKDEISALIQEAESVVEDVGSASADEVAFNSGKKAMRKPTRDWAKAIVEFSKVERSSEFWERAQVEIGICKWRLGDIDGALAVFNQYLDDFLQSTAAAGVKSPSALAKRREASATAEFFRGLIVFNRTEKTGDADGYRQVIVYLVDYESRYPEQAKSLAPWAMQMVVESHLVLGDRAKARDVFSKMVELFPEAKRTGAASLTFYDVLKNARGGDSDADVLREMAELLELSNTNSASPSFTNLRKESQHWMDLQEWAKAEGVLERLVAKYGEDEKERDSVRKFVFPDLGKALVEQKKLVEARAVLGPLMEDESFKAGKSLIFDWARSVTGWVEGDGDEISVVIGAGEDEAEFELATKRLAAIAQGGEKWTSCEWYQQKFMVVYTYYVWSSIDSRKLESARSQLADIEDMTGSQFKPVEEWCESDEAPQALRETLGGDVLRKRFLWLKRKLAG